MFAALLVKGLNHVGRHSAWVAARLRPHAGRQCRIEAGPVVVQLAIDGAGQFVAPAAAQPADVTITLPADTPVRWLLDRSSALAAARIAGSADLAEDLAFVFRHLRWDIEGDLAAVIGDIPAYRLSRWGRSLAGSGQAALQRTADNLVEYVADEQQLVVSVAEFSEFARAVATTRDDLARLEKRLARLAS